MIFYLFSINELYVIVLQTSLTNEMYGPTMLAFTLVAVLLFEMKMSAHRVVGCPIILTANFLHLRLFLY